MKLPDVNSSLYGTPNHVIKHDFLFKYVFKYLAREHFFTGLKKKKLNLEEALRIKSALVNNIWLLHFQ